MFSDSMVNKFMSVLWKEENRNEWNQIRKRLIGLKAVKIMKKLLLLIIFISLTQSLSLSLPFSFSIYSTQRHLSRKYCCFGISAFNWGNNYIFIKACKTSIKTGIIRDLQLITMSKQAHLSRHQLPRGTKLIDCLIRRRQLNTSAANCRQVHFSI